VGPSLFLNFLIYSQSVGLLGRVISSLQGLYLNTGQHKHRKNDIQTKYLCRKWGSNPRSQRPNERRQYMHWTARLPWPTCTTLYLYFFWTDCLFMACLSLLNPFFFFACYFSEPFEAGYIFVACRPSFLITGYFIWHVSFVYELSFLSHISYSFSYLIMS
jgi:hypothetical protein